MRPAEKGHDKTKMKRIGNIYDRIISLDNLRLAEARARQGKEKSRGVRAFDRDAEGKLLALHETLRRREFRTSPYHIFKVYEPKERDIYELPYYPDRIVHHAIMNVLGPMFNRAFLPRTYSSIEGRGAIRLRDRLKRDLRANPEGTRYCLKCDVRKYFPSIRHDVLKDQLRQKIKDKRALALLFEIIDSTDGLPIGNYTSQTLANFYGLPIVRAFCGRCCYLYTDDFVLLGSSKDGLRQDRARLCEVLASLGLQMKDNWQIFPVDARGIDFVGLRFFHGRVLLRKKIKCRMLKAAARVRRGTADKYKALGGYLGWLYASDSRNFNYKHNLIWQTTNNTQWRR